jgi:hypothetical protein
MIRCLVDNVDLDEEIINGRKFLQKFVIGKQESNEDKTNESKTGGLKGGRQLPFLYGSIFTMMEKSLFIRSTINDLISGNTISLMVRETSIEENVFLYVWYCINGFFDNDVTTKLWKSLTTLEKLKTNNYFNYFCIDDNSNEKKFIRDYIFGKYKPKISSDFLDAEFLNNFRQEYKDEDEYKQQVLSEYKRIIYSTDKKILSNENISTILPTLQFLEQTDYSEEQARIIKLFGREILVVQNQARDYYSRDNYFSISNTTKETTTFNKKIENLIGSKRLGIFSHNFSSIFNLLIRSNNRHLIDQQLFDELLENAKYAGVLVNIDVLKYIFEQVNLAFAEEKDDENEFYRVDRDFIIDLDLKLVEIDDVKDEDDDYYHFLNLRSKSLLNLLTFVYFSNLRGLVLSRSPYFVKVGGLKSRYGVYDEYVGSPVSGLKFIVDNIILASNESKDPKDVVKKCSVDSKRFIELQQCDKDIVINVDGIMEDGTGMIEMSREIIKNVCIFFTGRTTPIMKSFNIVTKDIKCFIFAFYYCDATKFLSRYTPTNYEKTIFNKSSLSVAKKMKREPFLYPVNTK